MKLSFSDLPLSVPSYQGLCTLCTQKVILDIEVGTKKELRGLLFFCHLLAFHCVFQAMGLSPFHIHTWKACLISLGRIEEGMQSPGWVTQPCACGGRACQWAAQAAFLRVIRDYRAQSQSRDAYRKEFGLSWHGYHRSLPCALYLLLARCPSVLLRTSCTSTSGP